MDELKDVFDNQNTVFSVIFGSAKNNSLENANDIDVLTVVKDKKVPYDKKKLQFLSTDVEKEIELAYMEECELDFRLKNLDCLYGTILIESKFLIGDIDLYHKKQEGIRKSKVTDKSILFHRLEALKALDSSLFSWDNFTFFERHETILHLLVKCNDKTSFGQICDDVISRKYPTNCHKTYTQASTKELYSAISSCRHVFGYLSAADELRKYQHPVFLRDILNSDGRREQTFKNCHEYMKLCERQKDKLDAEKVKSFIEIGCIECRKEFYPSEISM